MAGSAPSTDEGAPRSTDSADQRRDILRALQATAAAAAGRVYVQGLASQAVPLVLDPQPDDEILDMAAAPGSKTTQIAALMEGRGRLVANDRSRGRIYKLRAVLEQQGVHEVQVSQRPGESLGRLWSERFDRVLLDAPCSMEARFRADDPSSWDGWSPGRIKRLAGLQGRLLASAVRAVGPGGVVVYSTCTFAPEENEVVLHRALRRFAGVIELEQVELDLPQRRPGLTAWGARDLDPSLSRAVRLVPDGVVEGFFIARLRKLASTAR